MAFHGFIENDDWAKRVLKANECKHPYFPISNMAPVTFDKIFPNLIGLGSHDVELC